MLGSRSSALSEPTMTEKEGNGKCCALEFNTQILQFCKIIFITTMQTVISLEMCGQKWLKLQRN